MKFLINLLKESLKLFICIIFTCFIGFVFTIWFLFPFAYMSNWRTTSLYYILSVCVAVGIYFYKTINWNE